MLIDEFLPVYDAVERHQIDIHSSAARVYAAARKLDLSGSVLVRWLFRLRGLPALISSRKKSQQHLGLTLDGLLQSGFILLGETPPQEIVLGLIGKFWTASGCIQRWEAAKFSSFTTPDYAKAVWNFSLSSQANGITRLCTETRVLCLDETSRRRFRLYWRFIRPFSGLIRLEALRAIKRQAEKNELVVMPSFFSFHKKRFLRELLQKKIGVAKKLDQIIVVDVEATCWEGEPPPGEESEIIEIGVCGLIVATGQRADKQSILVRPERSRVSEFCTKLTTLTPAEVENGMAFLDACDILKKQYKSKNRVWASYGDYDRRQFAQQCQSHDVEYPFGPTHINVKNLFALAHGLREEVGMAKALELLQIPLEGVHHRAGDDAWNIARILANLLLKLRGGR